MATSLRALGREVGAEHTRQEAEVASTGFGAVGNDAAAPAEKDVQLDFPGESRRGGGDGRRDLSHPGWQRLAGHFVFYFPHESSELRGEVHFTLQVPQEGAAVADNQEEEELRRN